MTNYDLWKTETPPTYEVEEKLKCECCYEMVDELYTVRIPFRNIVKKEYYCLECSTNHNENEETSR